MALFHHGLALFISSREAQCPDLGNKSHPPSSSASRLTARAWEFLHLSQLEIVAPRFVGPHVPALETPISNEYSG